MTAETTTPHDLKALLSDRTYPHLVTWLCTCGETGGGFAAESLSRQWHGEHVAKAALGCGCPPAEEAPAEEAPADLMRRAADRLDAFDKAAGPAPWQVDDEDDSELRLVRGTALNGTGSWRSTDEIATHDTDTYGDSDDTYRDDPEYRVVRADFDLIVALRPLAGELAAFFRQQSEVVQPDGFAVRWALAVLGETDGAL